MTSFSDGETTAVYTYNPDNMRRSKTVNGVKTEHVWVGSEIALDITGNSVVSYMQGIKSNYGWYVYNAHGDVVQICDNNGVVKKSYDYDPYGNQLTEADALDKNPYRYSGEYYDAESGYIYLRARYYDSTTGRFISEDPAFDGFNWYAYCGGNPLNRWDPSGQSWLDWVPGIAAVTAGTIMCATGFGAPVGIGLITGGASSLTASALGAAGFDSQLVSIVNASMDVVVGTTLLFTPFAPVGFGMVGSGFGALIGGAISEELGGSYELGANIGSIVGGAIGGAVYGKVSEMKKISEINKISATKSPNKVCGTQCFVAGTLIEAAEGKKPIEEIQAGDIVLAENPETGEIALKKVVQTFENESDELVHVFVNGEEIITTPSHPFYVPKLGWTSAIKLRAGDVLVLSNGEYVIVEKVQHEILESPVKVYNFEVEDFHTYFVGESSVLVHNTCYTNKELIDAANKINEVQYSGHPFASKMNPISVTATSDGQIIVSKNRGIPGKISRAQAKAIFGDDVIFVRGGIRTNYDNLRWGFETPNYWHAEARAVQYMNVNGISTVGARQATSLPSCVWCAKLQKHFGINNLTGVVG